MNFFYKPFGVFRIRPAFLPYILIIKFYLRRGYFLLHILQYLHNLQLCYIVKNQLLYLSNCEDFKMLALSKP